MTVGITGTNGKTTTSYLVEAVLKARGNDPGLLGTIEARVGGSVRRLANTTPESLDLHRLFAEIERSGQDSVVMEVSSHALELDRTYGIPYDIAVFTNLSRDHLDFHGTMEDISGQASSVPQTGDLLPPPLQRLCRAEPG